MSNEESNEVVYDAKRRAEIDHSLRHPVMFFFTSGAAWLAVSLLLGCVSALKFAFPTFLEGQVWTSNGVLFHAHLNTFVYGWGMQAAIGVAIWLMARLSRQPSRAPITILVAGHLWNLAVSIGTLGILAGKGEGIVWMAFPRAVWPALLAIYAVIAVWSVVQFRVQKEGHVYISQWYLLGAFFWFPWVFLSGHFFTFVYNGNSLMNAAVASWFSSALMYLWFVPVGIAAIYYLVPKVSGRPVYSYKLALLGFWSLAIIAPWIGMQKLYGGPIPQNLQLFGAAASILFAIPALSVFINIFNTLRGRDEVIAHSPTLRFSFAAVVGLLMLGGIGFILNLSGVLRLSQFSISSYGLMAAAMYGFFSLAMFAAIYFIVPRLTRREWLSRRFIRWHFTFSVYGALALAIFGTLLGALLHGKAVETWEGFPWVNVVKQMGAYTTAIAVAWLFILYANIFFFVHLALMWLRLGRRSAHPTLLTHEERLYTDEPAKAPTLENANV